MERFFITDTNEGFEVGNRFEYVYDIDTILKTKSFRIYINDYCPLVSKQFQCFVSLTHGLGNDGL